MDMQNIYIKTAKATEEILRRNYHLPQRIRSLLIMIDGTKTVGELMDLAKILGDVTSILAELSALGFVQKKRTVPSIQQPAVETAGKNAGAIPDQKQQNAQPLKDTVDASLFNIS